jgi:hypothetical protein
MVPCRRRVPRGGSPSARRPRPPRRARWSARRKSENSPSSRPEERPSPRGRDSVWRRRSRRRSRARSRRPEDRVPPPATRRACPASGGRGFRATGAPDPEVRVGTTAPPPLDAARKADSAAASAALRAGSSSNASRAASAKPTIPATFSVPARRSRSCPPPKSSGFSLVPRRIHNAPTPCGPPHLCAESTTEVTPSKPGSSIRKRAFPHIWAASTCRGVARDAAMRAASATG